MYTSARSIELRALFFLLVIPLHKCYNKFNCGRMSKNIR